MTDLATGPSGPTVLGPVQVAAAALEKVRELDPETGPATTPSALVDAVSVAATVVLGAGAGGACSVLAAATRDWSAAGPGAGVGGLAALLALFVGVAVHEGAHALTARSVGLVVETVTLGTGPRVLAARRGRAHVVVRAFPFSGLVTYAPAFGDRWRRRTFAVVAAGPLVNLLLVAAGSLLLVTGGVLQQALAGTCVAGLVLLAQGFGRGGAAHGGHTIPDLQALSYLWRARGTDLPDGADLLREALNHRSLGGQRAALDLLWSRVDTLPFDRRDEPWLPTLVAALALPRRSTEPATVRRVLTACLTGMPAPHPDHAAMRRCLAALDGALSAVPVGTLLQEGGQQRQDGRVARQPGDVQERPGAEPTQLRVDERARLAGQQASAPEPQEVATVRGGQVLPQPRTELDLVTDRQPELLVQLAAERALGVLSGLDLAPWELPEAGERPGPGAPGGKHLPVVRPAPPSQQGDADDELHALILS